MGGPGERERGDDIDRAARRVVGMVDEAGRVGMRPPSLSTAKERMNGKPRKARVLR